MVENNSGYYFSILFVMNESFFSWFSLSSLMKLHSAEVWVGLQCTGCSVIGLPVSWGTSIPLREVSNPVNYVWFP